MISLDIGVTKSTDEPMPFSFEGKLVLDDTEADRLPIPQINNDNDDRESNRLSVPDDGSAMMDDSPATKDDDNSNRGSSVSKGRGWSCVSTDHSLPAGSALAEDNASIPEHLKVGGKQRDSLMSFQTHMSESRRDRLDSGTNDKKVTPEIMAQMKKLEALQRPFGRDSNDMRMSMESNGSSNDNRPRGDSALFDEKQLEFVKQARTAQQLTKSGTKTGQTPPNQNNEECVLQ
mmetsp:Transcript_2177/g.3291  ORF Transcript_2177/g.3291 Transcript_2177/m.3291 type:complete len:232 (-) Transcript_2177:354-1049(-)